MKIRQHVNIMKATGINPGQSNRFKNISKKFENDVLLGRELRMLKGEGIEGRR